MGCSEEERPIAWPTRQRTESFQAACMFAIIATILDAYGLLIYSWELNTTTSMTQFARDDFNGVN